MLMMDPPDHTRYRKLVNRGFTPRMIGQLEPHIRELTNEHPRQGAGRRASATSSSTSPPSCRSRSSPSSSACRSEDRHKIFEWSNRMIGSEDPEYIGQPTRRCSTRRSRCSCTRRRSPRSGAPSRSDDIITRAAVSAEVDGDSLSDMDFNLFFLLLSVAGNETTRNAIAHGMNAFLENPDQWDLLVVRPDAHIDGATEEILRWASPVMYFRRNATQRLRAAGQTIKEGDKISLWYISANRDEDVFDDPFRFDIDRATRTPTSRSAAAARTSASARSSPAWRSTCCSRSSPGGSPRVEGLGPPDRLRSNFIGGIKHLPVRLRAT